MWRETFNEGFHFRSQARQRAARKNNEIIISLAHTPAQNGMAKWKSECEVGESPSFWHKTFEKWSWKGREREGRDRE